MVWSGVRVAEGVIWLNLTEGAAKPPADIQEPIASLRMFCCGVARFDGGHSGCVKETFRYNVAWRRATERNEA